MKRTGHVPSIAYTILLPSLFTVLFLFPADHAQSELKAGTARVDITPPVGFHHYAFLGRPAPANVSKNFIGTGTWDIMNTGVHDSIYARVLALSDGRTSFTVVALDLIAFMPETVRSMLPDELRNVLFCSAHNHSAPATVRFIPPVSAYRTPYLDGIEKKIAEAIVSANNTMTPVAVRASGGTVDLSYNKLGGGKGLYLCGAQNPDHIPFEPVDKEVGVIRFDDLKGRPVAVVVNYASHPVVYWSGDKVSGEYPGACTRRVENALGNGALCLFTNGAGGDINPYLSCFQSFQNVETMGNTLADTVLAVCSRMDKPKQRPGKIAFHNETMTFNGIKELDGSTIDAELNVAVIDSDIAIVTGPGEFYVDHQLALKQRSSAPHTFFFGYTNGYLGYFPSKRAWTENWGKGVYEHHKWVEVGAGERLVDRALAIVAADLK